jgi:hypothetical protein
MLMHIIAVASKKRMVVDGERGFPLFQFYRQSLPAIFAKFSSRHFDDLAGSHPCGKSPRGTSHPL